MDEILHVVDKRENAESYQRLPTITRLAERIAAAAGRSGNLELVRQLTKLGGNGPIMANALASFGLQVTYLGTLGYPNLHPVFRDFATRAEVHSIAEPGTTDALEFDDGKIMIGKHASLKEVTWDNIRRRYGLEKFAAKFSRSDLVAFVNWTMLPYMSDLWEAILREVCPALNAPRRTVFFDLADPEKRTAKDIARALDLIGRFNPYFDVILGLNEKEALAIGEVCGVRPSAATPEALAETALPPRRQLAHRHARHPSCGQRAGRHRRQSQPGPGSVDAAAQSHDRRGRPFQFRLLPGKTARFGQRHEPAGRRGRQRHLCAHRAKPRHRPVGRIPHPRLVTPPMPAATQSAAKLPLKLEVVKYGHPVLRQKGARHGKDHCRKSRRWPPPCWKPCTPTRASAWPPSKWAAPCS